MFHITFALHFFDLTVILAGGGDGDGADKKAKQVTTDPGWIFGYFQGGLHIYHSVCCVFFLTLTEWSLYLNLTA